MKYYTLNTNLVLVKEMADTIMYSEINHGIPMVDYLTKKYVEKHPHRLNSEMQVEPEFYGNHALMLAKLGNSSSLFGYLITKGWYDMTIDSDQEQPFYMLTSPCGKVEVTVSGEAENSTVSFSQTGSEFYKIFIGFQLGRMDHYEVFVKQTELCYNAIANDADLQRNNI